MREYLIESNDCRVVVHALNKKDAWRQFFAEVRKNGWAGRIGMIAIMKPPGWKSENDNLGFRTYPVLWLMKQVPWDTLIESLAIHLGVSQEEASRIMSENIQTDRWAVPAEATDIEHDWKGRRITE